MKIIAFVSLDNRTIQREFEFDDIVKTSSDTVLLDKIVKRWAASQISYWWCEVKEDE